MKKLMFMLAAAAMAIGAQANSILWSATINGATASTPNIASGDYLVYLLDNSQWDTYVTDGKMNADYLTKASYDNSGFSANGTKLETGSQTAEGISASSINYAIVLVNSGATQYAILGTGTAATYDPESQAATSIDTVSTTGKRITGQSAGLTFSPISGGSSGVPEPTSGLLLLVGAGMLALRRKQK